MQCYSKELLIQSRVNVSTIQVMVHNNQLETTLITWPAQVLKLRLRFSNWTTNGIFVESNLTTKRSQNQECQYIIGYSHGQKYCKSCRYYIITDNLRCTECSHLLRTKSRYRKWYSINTLPFFSLYNKLLSQLNN